MIRGKILDYNGCSGTIISNEGIEYILLAHNIMYEDPQIGDLVLFKEEVFKTIEVCEKIATFVKRIDNNAFFQ